MKTRAGIVLACAGAFALWVPVASANAQELSEKAVNSFMDYAWSLTPQQFSKPDGTTILIDKKKRDDVVVPVDIAREVIKVGRLSAHAQVCDLRDDQIQNHRSLMRREELKNKWTPQQLVYISQLHLTTVMLLTGKIKLIEKEGDKEVVVEEGKEPAQSCTDEQRKKVKELITAYVEAGPQPRTSATAAAAAAVSAGKQPAAAQDAPVATGSTSPAGSPAAAAAAASAKQPAAAAPAPAAKK